MASDVPSLPPPILGHSSNMDVHGTVWYPTLRILQHIVSHLTVVTYKTKACKCYFDGIQNCCAFCLRLKSNHVTGF